MLSNFLLGTLAIFSITREVSAFSLNYTFNYPMNGVLTNLATNLEALDPTSACLKQFISDIDCPKILFDMTINFAQNKPNTTSLGQGCTSNCEQSFAGWANKTWDVCSQDQNEQVTDYFETTSAEQFMIRYFWGLCLRDLNNGTYCTLEQNPVTIERSQQSRYTKAQIAAGCDDTCFTQRSAMNWHAYAAQNNTAGIQEANVAEVCPDVDTSQYAVVQPLARLAAGDSPTSTSTTSTATNAPTAAASGASVTTTTSTNIAAPTLGISNIMPIPFGLAVLAFF